LEHIAHVTHNSLVRNTVNKIVLLLKLIICLIMFIKYLKIETETFITSEFNTLFFFLIPKTD